MTCFHPLQAVRIESSENPIHIISQEKSSQLALRGTPGLLQLPCGKCVGCRLSYSKNWAIRCMHEAQFTENFYNAPSTFVTLTYADWINDLNGGALNYYHVQLFLKRLRKALFTDYSSYAFSSNQDQPLRFYMCGEYGTQTFRPHYHLLFFNLGFTDESLYTVRNGHKLFTSDSLSSFWTDPKSRLSYGHAVTGSVTAASAGYVARYCVKKALQGKHAFIINKDTGEYLPDEFTQMSRRPGIAHDWFKVYHKDVFPSDKLVMTNGIWTKPPRYYDNLLEKESPEAFAAVKASRLEYLENDECKYNNSRQRLYEREIVQLSKLKLLPRGL